MLEKKLRLVLGDDNHEFVTAASAFLKQAHHVHLVGIAHDGATLLTQVRDLRPDVVIVDMVMPRIDGLGVLESLHQLPHRPRIIMVSPFGSEEFIRKCMDAGADYFLLKPFNMDLLATRLRQLAGSVHSTIPAPFADAPAAHALESEVRQVLLRLGIPAHLKGYRFLREAIVLIHNNPEYIGGITKELYPCIAKKFLTTSSRVERSIRHAIVFAWNRGNTDFMADVFGPTIGGVAGKPTNSRFAATIADHLRHPSMKLLHSG